MVAWDRRAVQRPDPALPRWHELELREEREKTKINLKRLTRKFDKMKAKSMFSFIHCRRQLSIVHSFDCSHCVREPRREQDWTESFISLLLQLPPNYGFPKRGGKNQSIIGIRRSFLQPRTKAPTDGELWVIAFCHFYSSSFFSPSFRHQ